MKLTKAQLERLRTIAETNKYEYDGQQLLYIPRGAGDWRTTNALEKLGLVTFEGYAQHVDEYGTDEKPAFRITESGKQFLAAMRSA